MIKAYILTTKERKELREMNAFSLVSSITGFSYHYVYRAISYPKKELSTFRNVLVQNTAHDLLKFAASQRKKNRLQKNQK